MYINKMSTFLDVIKNNNTLKIIYWPLTVFTLDTFGVNYSFKVHTYSLPPSFS